jgi:hypothetical protein
MIHATPGCPRPTHTAIDMLNPAETCAELQVDECQLLELIEHAKLAAFNLGGEIRFRYREVSALTTQLRPPPQRVGTLRKINSDSVSARNEPKGELPSTYSVSGPSRIQIRQLFGEGRAERRTTRTGKPVPMFASQPGS